jgi:hypothetical protein
MRSSITCLASILDSLLSILSSNFLRLSVVPDEEQVDVLVALAEEDDEEPIDDTVPVASPTPVPATPPPAILGRSIEPVSLNPDPLLGFLSVCRRKQNVNCGKQKHIFRARQIGTTQNENCVTHKNAVRNDDPPPLVAVIERGWITSNNNNN